MCPVQTYGGRAFYRSDYHHGAEQHFVAVLCRPLDSPDVVPPLLDTAAEWCVLPAKLARDWGCAEPAHQPEASLLTRFGRTNGHLSRLSIVFPALQGADLTVDATCFISDSWPGPMVIGWKGCLERMRFALDPGDESFYFAAL
jgi:hypothetical protein